MSDNGPILSRIQKLLALSQSKGATEAEAALAAEHVQRLLQDNGLTMAQVEAEGGNTDDVGGKREKRTTDRRAMYAYQRSLMGALAANNFCLHIVVKIKNAKPLYSGGRGVTSRCHMLVGRFINVQATEQMYDYLETTMRRLASETGIEYRNTRDLNFFLDGATSRVVERLMQRRREREREEATARAGRQATGNGTGRELVVTDVYGSEADLNNDALNGFPTGTTAAHRRAAQAKSAAREARESELITQGVEATEAFYQSYGYGVEEAKTYADKWRKRSNRRSGGRGRSTNWAHADDKHYEKINSSSYKAGRDAGDSISLDAQVGVSERKMLGRGSKS